MNIKAVDHFSSVFLDKERLQLGVVTYRIAQGCSNEHCPKGSAPYLRYYGVQFSRIAVEGTLIVRVAKGLEELCPIFLKVAKTVAKLKSSKISTPKLNLKTHSALIKPHLKP